MTKKEHLKIVIVDDERSAIETLVELLKLTQQDYLISGTAIDKKSAIELVQKTNPDVLLLDIELITSSGFEIIEALGKDCPEIVFTTAHDHYAVNAFRVGASDFLLKPISVRHLEESLIRVRERLTQGKIPEVGQKAAVSEKIMLKSSSGVDYIEPKELCYISVEGSYCTFILNTGEKLVTSSSLKEYQERLEPLGFFRVSHSILLNLDHIRSFKRIGEKSRVVLSDGAALDVSRRRRTLFIDAMNARFGSK